MVIQLSSRVFVGLAIALCPEYFTNDPLKVAYTITLLRDKAHHQQTNG